MLFCGAQRVRRLTRSVEADALFALRIKCMELKEFLALRMIADDVEFLPHSNPENSSLERTPLRCAAQLNS